MRMPATPFETTGTALPSAPILTGWAYPSKVGSAHAEVLALFLEGHTLTSLDALKLAGVFRLAAVVHALRRQGWPILSTDTEVGCSDGHTAIVAAYSLPNDAITEAMQDGAAAWCASVKEARALKRAKAAKGLQ